MKNDLKMTFLFFLCLTACAPKAEDRHFDAPKTIFGPNSRDTDLTTRLKAFDQTSVVLNWQDTVSTASYFQQSENLVILGELLKNPALKEKGLNWIKRFYQQPKMTSTVDLAQTPFAALASAQTQIEVQKTLGEVSGEIQKSRDILRSKIQILAKNYPWPKKAENLEVVLKHAMAFTNEIMKALPSMGLPDLIETSLQEELPKQTKPLFTEIAALIEQMKRTTTLSQVLNLVDKTIKEFEVDVPQELLKSMQQGRIIAQGLDSMQDSQGGLRVLIDIWKILSPKEQAEYFQAVNDSLYDFLSKQDEKELNCLRLEGCSGGLFKGIAKKLFILPKIKQYGLEKLKAEMNAKTREYVLAQIEAFAVGFVTEIPQTFSDRIDKGLVDKGTELSSVQQNYGDYLKKLLATWSLKILPETKGQVNGFEVSNVKVDISAKNKMSLEAVGNLGDLKANTAGTSIMVNSLLMENVSISEPLALRTALSQVNKLISIGGYRDDQNKLIPALLSPVDPIKKPLDIMNLTASASAVSYRIPDKIRLQDAFHADEKMVYDKNFSASALAEQIKGLSHMLRLTADWKETNFDRVLGGIKAQDLTQEIQSDALNRALFPKDMLFALNLGDVAVLLQDITKKATPVFLLTLKNQVLWADQYSASTETAIMAGIVDIKEGRKSNVVQAQDVAKFLMAITDFLQATEGVENTKSSLLLEKDANGVAALDTLIEGRRDLKLLVVALANFISNQLMSEKHLVQDQYYLNEKERANNPEYRIEAQVYGIRALLKAWEVTELETYLWSAQEIYFAMNKNLYNQKERFYVNGDESKLDFPQKINTLVALMQILPHLPNESQAQLQKISSPWLKALQDLQ